MRWRREFLPDQILIVDFEERKFCDDLLSKYFIPSSSSFPSHPFLLILSLLIPSLSSLEQILLVRLKYCSGSYLHGASGTKMEMRKVSGLNRKKNQADRKDGKVERKEI